VELPLAVGILVDLGPANPDGSKQDHGNNCGKISHAQPPEYDSQKKSRPVSKQLTRAASQPDQWPHTCETISPSKKSAKSTVNGAE
jgi:hypothetical protein